LAEINDKVEAFESFLEENDIPYEEKCYASMNEQHKNELQDDCLYNELPLSSHKALAHAISDLDEEKCDEVLEDFVVIPHEEDPDGGDSSEDAILHLVPGVASLDASTHLLDEDIPAVIMDSEEDKGLVSYGDFPFQIFKHDEVLKS
jgi:hypothetical protein